MITGKTGTGFEFSIDENTLDDYELFELICEVDNGASAKTPRMVEGVLGKEQKKRLMAHIKERNGGRCSVSAMAAEFSEIMKSASETKNS